MAISLPPPPSSTSETDSFAWIQWYNQLYQTLVTNGAVSWAGVDKTGSSIADLANHDHSSLTGVLGSGAYHLSALTYSRVSGILSQATNPTTSDIASDTWAIYRNTTTGLIRLWVNDAGTMKSVTLV